MVYDQIVILFYYHASVVMDVCVRNDQVQSHEVINTSYCYVCMNGKPIQTFLVDDNGHLMMRCWLYYGRPMQQGRPLYFCPVVSSFYISSSSSIFFLACFQPSQIGCLPYFHTWCGLSANLGCRSETCCTRLAENTGRKKSPSRHHRTTFSGHIFATKAHIYNRKKT